MVRAFARSWSLGLMAGVAVIVALGLAVMISATRALRSARSDVDAAAGIRFTASLWHVPAAQALEFISAPSDFTQAAVFQDHLYLAGTSGLSEIDVNGVVLHQYEVGRDLPSSPLGALTTATLSDSREPELVIATADQGLLAFNGHSFRQIAPKEQGARQITAIASTASGHLLLGTKKLGVLVYDGKRLAPLHASLRRDYVTALNGDESDLWIGTLNSGVLHYHAGQTDRFSEAEGLPDARVSALATKSNLTYVGTPLGVAVFDSGRFSRILATGVFASALLVDSNQLYIGTEDQGIVVVPLTASRPNESRTVEMQALEVRQIFPLEDSVLAVTPNGLYRKQAHELGWKHLLQSGGAIMADRNVSALAVDGTGRLWIGYFDRGLDILSSDRQHANHVEDEHVFCVNRILVNSNANMINVATANGLVRFNNAGAIEQILTRADGLIADHVTDVAAYRDGLAVATPAGLTFLDASGAQSLYAFQGLVNNHVYALAASGDRLMAGTLGGISVLDKSNITENYTTSSSNLAHNWITALVPVGPEWMVGTYGAGILSLDRDGKFHSFEKGSGQFEVNPNAMLVTDAHVFTGTSGRGLYVYDRESGRWSTVDSGLPSLNVTAIASGGGYLYIGTDNGVVRIREQELQP